MKTPQPTLDRIRLTITVTPHVHATFAKLADAENISLGKAMGNWLGDTADASAMMAKAMEDAKGKPREVLRRLQALSMGVVDATEETLSAMRTGCPFSEAGPQSADKLEEVLRAQAAPPARAGRGGPPPRPVIRGGKSTEKKMGRKS
jgi:hypothetical protein